MNSSHHHHHHLMRFHFSFLFHCVKQIFLSCEQIKILSWSAICGVTKRVEQQRDVVVRFRCDGEGNLEKFSFQMLPDKFELLIIISVSSDLFWIGKINFQLETESLKLLTRQKGLKFTHFNKRIQRPDAQSVEVFSNFESQLINSQCDSIDLREVFYSPVFIRWPIWARFYPKSVD